MPPHLLALLAALPAVEIVAHRGASHDSPENTVAAIRLAWRQNADASEFDIHLTKDGKIVVIHDADTKRTSGTPGKVKDLAFDEIRKLDVGRWKGAAFAGERVPTLAEMLATVPAGRRAFVEVKCGPEIVPTLVKELAASGLRPEQTPVISFNAAVIAAYKKARPDAPAYWLAGLGPKKGEKPPAAEALIAKAREIKADGLDLSASPALDAAFVKKVKDAGLKLHVYTVNDAAEARRLAALGVDGITTDRPGWLRERLSGR